MYHESQIYINDRERYRDSSRKPAYRPAACHNSYRTSN